MTTLPETDACNRYRARHILAILVVVVLACAVCAILAAMAGA